MGRGAQLRDKWLGPILVRAIVCVFVLAIGLALTLAYFDKQSADRYWQSEAAFRRIETRAQEIRNLGWLVVTTEDVSPEAEARIEAAKVDLLATDNSLQPQPHNAAIITLIRPSITGYLNATARQLHLVKSGNPEAAQEFDFREVTPQFEVLQRQVHDAGQTEGRLAEAKALRSRLKIGLAATLGFVLLILGLRYERQRHVVQLTIAQQTALAQSEERFRELTEKSADIVFITDAAGTINYVSSSVKMLLGVDGESFVHKNLGDATHPDDRPHLREAFAIGVGQTGAVDFRLQHPDGRWLYFESIVRNLLNQRNINGLVLNAREITERKKAEDQLLHNASHDLLTGLPNRVLFLNRLETVIDRIKRHPQQMAAVLFVDMDDFKVVNDCIGHAAGDELIIEVGRRLKGCMRDDGTIARIGGDEFTVLLEEVTDPSDAIRVAQRIHASFIAPFVLAGQEVFKDASIGIALATANDTSETVLQNADLAMYRAKSKGKGCSELFDADMQDQVMGRLKVETQLRHALQNNEFRIFYQPIVVASTGALEGFEALLRWQPQGGSIVSPASFIPIAEQSGLIVPIGSWVLASACKQVVAWQRSYALERSLYVSINVSGRQFSHPNFITHVKDALEQSGIDPQCVKLEITETAAMKDASSTEMTMAQLHALGVKLSIDDFGTGYSSLNYLRRFAVDTLKIDQSFIAKMEASRENYEIVKTVVALARSLGLGVVAEGVETASQLEKIKLADCDSAQGYLFAKPLPEELVGFFIEENSKGRFLDATSNARLADVGGLEKRGKHRSPSAADHSWK